MVLARPGMSDPRPVIEYLATRAQPRSLAPLTMTAQRMLAQDLADWEGRVHSWSWAATSEQISAAVAEAQRWAADEGWPLARRVKLQRTIQWWAFDLIATA
jgi:hypothetical protein